MVGPAAESLVSKSGGLGPSLTQAAQRVGPGLLPGDASLAFNCLINVLSSASPVPAAS